MQQVQCNWLTSHPRPRQNSPESPPDLQMDNWELKIHLHSTYIAVT